jgi:hypothetical protein
VLELFEMMSRRVNAVLALGTTDHVLPSPTPKAKVSRLISWGRTFFQPFALATPLYSISFRLTGGELPGFAQ